MLKGPPLPLECFKPSRNTCSRLHCLSAYSGLLLHLCCLYSGSRGERGPRCVLPATVYHVYNLNADGPCVLKGNYLIWNRSRRGKCCPTRAPDGEHAFARHAPPHPGLLCVAGRCAICAVLSWCVLGHAVLCCAVFCFVTLCCYGGCAVLC